MTSVNGRWIREAKRISIYARDGYRCLYCGTHAWGTKLTLDHYRTRSNAADNLVTACLSCNSSKQGRSTRQWYAYLRSRGADTVRIQLRIRLALARSLR